MTKRQASASTNKQQAKPDKQTQPEQAEPEAGTENDLKPRLEQLEHDLKRALADYQNLVKQTEKEKQHWFEHAQTELLKRWLPVVDSLYLAQKHLQDQGLELVIKQIKQLWQELGVEEINPQPGDGFDPHLHECIDTQPADKPELKGKIIETTRFGLRWTTGNVIRHAQVRVYSQD